MKTFVLIFLVTCCYSGGFAQSSKLPEPHSSFAAIIVSNIDSSINWYCSNLGMVLKNKTISKERGFKQANLIRAQIHIELIELNSTVSKKDILKNSRSKDIRGFVKFGFVVKGFADWYSYLVKQKVKFRGRIITDDKTGKRTMIIMDPDDNMIQIFEG